MARESALVIQSTRGETVVSASIRSHAVECDGGITIRFEGRDVELYLELGPEDAERLFYSWQEERFLKKTYLAGLAAIERAARERRRASSD